MSDRGGFFCQVQAKIAQKLHYQDENAMNIIGIK